MCGEIEGEGEGRKVDREKKKMWNAREERITEDKMKGRNNMFQDTFPKISLHFGMN